MSQELRLPDGEYTLTCDLWKSGLGGDAFVSVATEGGTTITSPSLANKTEWQQVSMEFQSDGKASTTIRLTAMHNSDGSEKIIGFDNVVLTRKVEDGLHAINSDSIEKNRIYDLQGRRMHASPAHGLYIINDKIILKR